ncbi:hypothetical protein V8E55_003267 [Tylopilus felleus]
MDSSFAFHSYRAHASSPCCTTHYLAAPASEIGSKQAIVQRPILRLGSDRRNKAQLPLLIRPLQRE